MAPQISPSWENFSICLPHPYLTRYHVESTPISALQTKFKISPSPASGKSKTQSAPCQLHNAALSFSSPKKGHSISEADNTPWARTRRSPSTTFAWTSAEPPTIAQLWLLVYSLFTVEYKEESVRLILVGTQTDLIRDELVAVGLAIMHPVPINATPSTETWADLRDREVVLLRSSFWQGAGSPFGPRSAWLPSPTTPARQPVHAFPLFPTTQTLSTKFPSARIHALHPVRPAKPTPGSIIYSRYIPHLDENFSMIALNYKDAEHLKLFHTWQNDPRVAAGWNETGTLEQHRKYLKDLHEDPHTLTMLALFEDVPFAYFEVYWAKVCS